MIEKKKNNFRIFFRFWPVLGTCFGAILTTLSVKGHVGGLARGGSRTGCSQQQTETGVKNAR